MAERVLTYERLGPDASHGFKFEISTTGLAYLRCEKLYKQYMKTKTSGVKTFFVANNVKNIGQFDDVVIRVEYLVENEIRSKLIFVQCKHLADVASTSDNKYMEYLNKKDSVQKYFNSFLSIYQILQTNLCTVEKNHLRNFLDCKFDDCDFVFYSNIDLQHVKKLDMFELIPKRSKKDITENLLMTTKTDFLRLKLGESKNLKCLPAFENLKTVFCQNFKIILNQEGNSGNVLAEEIRLFLKIGMKIKSVCNVFKEEIESHFNSYKSCVALSEDSNLVEKSIAYDMLKCKSVETISQFQKNSFFDALFSKEIIQNIQEKFSNNLDYPFVVKTNFKDLEKRKFVQLFLNLSDCIIFLNDVTDMESWHLARQMKIYKKIEAVIIFSEVDFMPTIKNHPENNERLVQIIFNKSGNDSLPNTDEFSDETKALIFSKKIEFQGHLQKLVSICGNEINFLFDEKIICEILEESSTLKICDSLEEQEFYINRKFREKTIKHANISQKYMVEKSLKEIFKLLLFSENNKNIPNLKDSYVWFENMNQARNFLREIPESTNDTIHLCGRREGLIYTFGKNTQLGGYTIVNEIDFLAGPRKMSKIVLLTDIAGMGKSTTFKFFANKYKEKYPSHWVFFIELNKYLDKLKNFQDWSDIRFVVKFVATHLINLKDHESRAFQKACIETGNVVLFFDAFDEISPDVEMNFPLLLEALESTKIFCKFVSSRPNYARRLEQHFCQNSIEFDPLENDEIKEFFYEQWTSRLLKDAMSTERSEVEIKNSVCNFLNKILHPISDELLKIPLQMKMISELFYEKFKLYFQNTDSDEYSNIDMYNLYSDFCNLLAKRYYIEKEGWDWNKKKENDKNIAIEEKLAGIEKIACKIICPEFHIPEDKHMKNINTKMCDHLGLLTHINPPRFSHRTYGEFLAAKYIAKQLCTKNVAINVKFMSILFHDILLNGKYNVLRKFIDSAYSQYEILNNCNFSYVEMPGNHIMFGEKALFTAIEEHNFEIIKFIILCNPIVVNATKKPKYKTPLMIACEEEKTDVVTYILTRRECTLNIVDVYGQTALHHASKKGNTHIHKLLIEHDPTLLNKKDFDGFTALHIACGINNYEAAKHLLSYPNCSVAVANIYGELALHYAAQSGNIKEIKLLLDRYPAMLNVQDILGALPLHVAVIHDKLEVVKFLIIECKCPPNVIDWYRRTSLHYAVRVENTNYNLIKFLIQQDQSLMNRQDCHGMTALHLACELGKYEAVKCLLLYSDCLVNVQDILLKNAIHYLIEPDFYFPIETINLLLERDITLLDEQDINGDTALHIACSQNNIQLVKHLISYRCRLVHNENNFLENSLHTDLNSRLVHSCCDRTLLNMQNGVGMTPLHIACKSNNKDTIHFLLSLPDCNVNVIDSSGKYAIHYAASTNNISIISLLLKKDYTLLNKQDVEGNTSLNIACRNNRIGVAHLLLTYPDCLVNLENILNYMQSATSYNILQELKVVELILQRDHSLFNKQSEDGTTLLLFACKNGKAGVAEFLLSHSDCVVNFEDTAKRNRLHYAAENESTEIIKIILERDKTLLNKKDKNGMTPLHIACKRDNNKAVNFLLSYKDCSVHIQDEKKRFAIHYAAKYLDVKILKHMLERDHTLLNKKDENDMTPLHFSCIHYNGEATKFLLSLTECEVSTLDKRNRSALHYAIEKLNINISKLILERDFSLLNKQDIDGNTPLHLACKSAFSIVLETKVVEYLLSLSDCLINVENNMKRTPLDYAYQTFIDSLDMRLVDLFLERDNTLLDKHDIKIETFMTLFDEESVLYFTNFINHKYFKIDLKDDDGNTFFHTIANIDYGGPYLMNILLERNPQLLNMQNKNCQTALHIAAKKHNFKVLNFLLNLTECNVSVKDDNGDTALHIYVHLFDEDHGCVDGYYDDDGNDDDDGFDDDYFKCISVRREALFNHKEFYCDFSLINQFIRRDHSLLNMQGNLGQTPLHMAVQTGNSNYVRYLLYLGAFTDINDKNGNTPLDLARQLQDLSIKHRIVNYLQNKLITIVGD